MGGGDARGAAPEGGSGRTAAGGRKSRDAAHGHRTARGTVVGGKATPHIACLPGDGIGPEVIAVARHVLDAAGFDAEWSGHPVGWTEWCERGDALPEATLAACRSADAVLFGAITSKPDEEAQRELAPHLQGRNLRYRSPIVRLRRDLGLFANVRPSRGDGVDLVIFRENTEDLYAGFEARPIPAGLYETWPDLPMGDAAVTLRLVTRTAWQRLVRKAFDWAEAHDRRRVTLVEKATVLRATGGLVREVFDEVAAEHPGLRADELIVDTACALMVRDPSRFDVVVATNLFGDILSDLAAEVAGGLPAAASANLGDEHALFEPVHGSAPDIAGQGIADPTGAVRAAATMARHLGQAVVADTVEAAVDEVVSGPTPTTTAAWAEALVAAVSARNERVAAR